MEEIIENVNKNENENAIENVNKNENENAIKNENENQNGNKKSFGQTVKYYCKRWFIDAFTGMAQGLFVTLIAGLIISQIGKLIGAETAVGKLLCMVGSIATMLTGAGIGAGIAKALKSSNLVIFSCMVAGYIGGFSEQFLGGSLAPSFKPGNPIGAYVCALFAVEISMLISGKTKLDILLVPLTVFICTILGCYIAKPFIWLIGLISQGIEIATNATPFFMGIIISVVMGILLTMPTSSAAIWIAIATGNTSDAMMIAGGAAVVGCASHMVGFAVASFRENGVSGLISQGLGTSMLQIPNIMRKPMIMLPAIISSAIVGPMATTLFKIKCVASGGGMGTSGLVGMFGVLSASGSGFVVWLGIILLMFIIPAVVSFITSEILRKKNIIRFGDMKLSD